MCSRRYSALTKGWHHVIDRATLPAFKSKGFVPYGVALEEISTHPLFSISSLNQQLRSTESKDHG